MKDIISQIKSCNVIYHKLGKTDRSAMPIGNGELCSSVWVNEKGQICFYLARTDAMTELDRNVKLGMVKIDLNPNPFVNGYYEQELDLADGQIYFRGDGARITMLADMKCNAISLSGTFEQETEITASYITWRNQAAYSPSEFSYTEHVMESADIVKEKEKGILFYHKNGKTIIPETARVQNMADSLDVLPDALTNRIFGGFLYLDGGKSEGRQIVKKDAKECLIHIFTESMQGEEAEFEANLQRMLEEKRDFALAERECREFWNAYWNNSYIFIEKDVPAEKRVRPQVLGKELEPSEYTVQNESAVTKAYVWTRYMMRCCADGAFPILYNGMLFNLCPGNYQHYEVYKFGDICSSMPEEPTSELNPDERSWCVENLWQNIRHPYHTFLKQGTPELMKPIFAYYRRFWELNRVRAKKYYHAEGQHNTEMTMSFGLQSNGIYGEDRTGKPDGYAQNRHGGAVDISPGMELLSMMLDYYEYTKDEVFLKEEIQVYAKDLYRYIETRFLKREGDKLIIGPLHSIETYWETTNPITVVAGLHDVTARLLKVEALEEEFRKYFEVYQKKIPSIPTAMEDGRLYLQPAEVFSESRENVEIPELYACFPFYGFDYLEDGKDMMKRTFEKRIAQYECDKAFYIGDCPDVPSYSGWQYLGIVAARLGMTEKAQEILEKNVQLNNPGNRFPAMWGPIYDGVPDTDHAANIVHQLQEMVMQVKDGKADILPAFPMEWNVQFKLHLDSKTTISAEYRDGTLEKLEVVPESERERVTCDIK